MRILALDPAKLCGWAVSFDGRSIHQSGTWNLGEPDVRLKNLWALLLASLPLDVLAVEDSAYGSREQFVTQLAHAEMRGVIRLLCQCNGIKLLCYKPKTIKACFTGSGKATKDQIMRACETLFRIEPNDDNEADAMAILWCAMNGIDPHPGATKKRKVKEQRKREAIEMKAALQKLLDEHGTMVTK